MRERKQHAAKIQTASHRATSCGEEARKLRYLTQSIFKFIQAHDNDYPSDDEQVVANKGTLKEELLKAMKKFVKRDPLRQVSNLKEDLTHIDHGKAMLFEESVQLRCANGMGCSNLSPLQTDGMSR